MSGNWNVLRHIGFSVGLMSLSSHWVIWVFSAQGCHNIIRHGLGKGDLGWLGGVVGRVIWRITGIVGWTIGDGGVGGHVGLLIVSFLHTPLPQFVQAKCEYHNEYQNCDDFCPVMRLRETEFFIWKVNQSNGHIWRWHILASVVNSRLRLTHCGDSSPPVNCFVSFTCLPWLSLCTVLTIYTLFCFSLLVSRLKHWYKFY